MLTTHENRGAQRPAGCEYSAATTPQSPAIFYRLLDPAGQCLGTFESYGAASDAAAWLRQRGRDVRIIKEAMPAASVAVPVAAPAALRAAVPSLPNILTGGDPSAAQFSVRELCKQGPEPEPLQPRAAMVKAAGDGGTHRGHGAKRSGTIYLEQQRNVGRGRGRGCSVNYVRGVGRVVRSRWVAEIMVKYKRYRFRSTSYDNCRWWLQMMCEKYAND